MNQTPQTETMDETIGYIYREMIEPFVPDFVTSIGYVPWMFSLIGSALVGLAGILPLLIIPVDVDGGVKDKDIKEKDPANSKTLKVLLSFAVGGLLGDVFLHLLPEAWESDNNNNGDSHQHPSMRSGMWVLTGVLLFTIVEKIFSGYVNADENNPQPKCVEIANCLLRRSREEGKEVPEGTTCCAGDIEDVPNGCFLATKHLTFKQQQRIESGIQEGSWIFKFINK